jgi:hypothetical protein
MSTAPRARPGAERSDVAPIWPTALIPADTRLIYLDLNQWIALAKANAGHPDGARWRSALEALRGLRAGSTYVISMPLIMELTGILRPAQRAELTEVIEEFTDFACMIPLTTIAGLEFESALARAVPITEQFAQVPILGRGVMRACGMDGRLRVRNRSGADVTEHARMHSPVGPEEFDRRLAEGERLLDRSVIRGPAGAEEESELRAMGWDPSAARRVAEKRAQQEREHAKRLDGEPRWRRGRLRDVVAARYLALEIEEVRDRVLLAHGIRLHDVLTDPSQAREFTDSMRTADVWITLMTAKHRNRDSLWRSNDIFDVDALSVAGAYCDVVVTERHAAHVLRRAAIHERFGTRLLTDLDQLASHLQMEHDGLL